jgi:hypothetical protein
MLRLPKHERGFNNGIPISYDSAALAAELTLSNQLIKKPDGWVKLQHQNAADQSEEILIQKKPAYQGEDKTVNGNRFCNREGDDSLS